MRAIQIPRGFLLVTAVAAAIVILLLTSTPTHAETIVVPAGGDLQAAINSAQPCDTIIVQAGATYTRDFVLPNKPGACYVTIQSSRASELPEGVRVGPAQSALFAKMQSANLAAPVITTAPGAHHYRFIGIEISTASATKVYDLVQLGSGTQTAANVPHDFIFDRTYIHGFSTQEVQRGIALNGAEISVSNSYISEIHGTGYDTQALCGWNGPGPFHIINNYLEAAGENILFGGADPSIANLIPSNIEIRRNDIFKPLRWKVGDPSYAGIHWTIKNLLEIKTGRNVVIDKNNFENSWGDAQIGYGVLFTVRNQDGGAPWAVVENVQFTNNVVKNTEQGLQLLGKDSPNISQRSSGVMIVNNLFTGIKNRFFTMSGFYNVALEHNTHEQGGNILTLHGEQSFGFKYLNNVTLRHEYGFFGDGVGEGTVALQKYTPDADVRGSVIAAADVRFYPAENFYPVDLSNVGSFKGTDGLTPGYSAGAAIPLPSPTPTPSPVVTPTPTPQPTASPTPVPTPTPPPSPTPQPSPAPSPSPSPTPSPTCSMSVTVPTLDQWTTGTLQVNVLTQPSSTFTVSATGTSGQVVVLQPTTSKPITGTSAIVAFQVSVKKKSAPVSVIGPGPCGQQVVTVPVR